MLGRGRDGRGARAAVVVTGAVLVAMAATGRDLASSGRPGGGVRTPPVGTLQGVSASSRSRRPFDHRRHTRVSCRACHGTGPDHRTILVRTSRDCASCHHDERRAQTCGDCHSAEQLAPRRSVATVLSLTVWDTARRRALTFRHDVHTSGASPIVCRECHGAPVTLAMDRTCASCHVEHHRPDATCTSCHVAAKPGTHDAKVHLSCAGSGCHAAAVAPSPTLSRTLCLACHAAQTAHEPQGSCAACHRIPEARRRGGALGTAAGREERAR